jgi:hypothetical protein
MDTENGILRVTYNAMWGHYALHWESADGEFLEDDEDEVKELIWGLNERNCDHYKFIRDAIAKMNDCSPKENWVVEFEIEDGIIRTPL